MPLQDFIDATNEFDSMSLRDARRELPQIEATIAELMDATFHADQETKPVMASLEYRLRILRMQVLRL